MTPPNSGHHPLLRDAKKKEISQHRPRNLHMRTGSTGSVRGAFYSTDDEYAPQVSRQHQPRRRRHPPTKLKPHTDRNSSGVYGVALLPDGSSSSRYEMPQRGTSLNVSDWSVPLDNHELTGMNFVADLSPTATAEEKLLQPSAAGSLNVPYGAMDYTNLQPPDLTQKQDIAMFAAMALDDGSERLNGSVGSLGPSIKESLPHPLLKATSLPPGPSYPGPSFPGSRVSGRFSSDESNDDEIGESSSEESSYNTMGSDFWDKSFCEKLLHVLDPRDWLERDAVDEDTDSPYFEQKPSWTIASLVRLYVYNPIAPEFSSLQQFTWAVIIGILMGIYTAFWKNLIESGVDFVWRTIPEALLKMGVFTELGGWFPLYHYVWICPGIFGGILSYTFAALKESPFKIPDQNEWIDSVHTKGVQDSKTFLILFVLSTLGMLSGLSLGPELPLVLTAGMAGSWFGLLCEQSMLQARVLNLTAASAAVGGFFGFPMAGALFVLEIPHRMGLQYFEALSPATISSIVAVLCNRMIVGNDVTGYFKYPFLTSTLPSEIFTNAIFYGLYGAGVGIVYAWSCMKLKNLVHDLFHAPHHSEGKVEKPAVEKGDAREQQPLMANSKRKKTFVHEPTLFEKIMAFGCIYIKDEPKRAALSGAVAGMLVGAISMFVPHVLFWGESQLQNLIDKGRTPLPVFGQEDEPTAALTALGYCMIDPHDPIAIKEGFSVECALLIIVAKIFVIGLSLGTGIVGGHFWGPLFVGCAASHLLTDLCHWFSERFGFGTQLSMYPCLVILCTMGSAHVVTFRAHMAIMLILTLTISAFDSENDVNSPFSVAGDYSAVFPLLVVSVFISLMASRNFVFYKTQRSRGDITAVPEVLCRPGMEGSPLVIDYERKSSDDSPASSDGVGPFDEQDSHDGMVGQVRTVPNDITQEDIERNFARNNVVTPLKNNRKAAPQSFPEQGSTISPTTDAIPPMSDQRLDELLSRPRDDTVREMHRRSQSALPRMEQPSVIANRERSGSNGSGSLVRINSFGEIQDTQPSLLDQARERSASTLAESRAHRRLNSIGSDSRAHRRHPSLPSGRHSRNASISSLDGPLTADEIAATFEVVTSKQSKENDFGQGPWTNNNA